MIFSFGTVVAVGVGEGELTVGVGVGVCVVVVVVQEARNSVRSSAPTILKHTHFFPKTCNLLIPFLTLLLYESRAKPRFPFFFSLKLDITS
jgi:hypothetical protein